MNYLLIFLMTFFAYPTLAQSITYKEWNKQSKSNMRLFPKYGNQQKDEKLKAFDQELIDTYVAQEGTRRKASEFLIDIGFEYFYSGNIVTAMYRFNQAWLLDPDNEDTYWGWGSVYYHFKDYPRAMALYNEGLGMNPKNPRLLTDKGTLYMGEYYDKNDSSALQTAIQLFSESYFIDSTNQNTAYKLSVAYFNLKDCDNARKFYDVCLNLGGKPISENYTESLKTTCNR